METSLEISEKEVQINNLHSKMLSFHDKIAKIGPAHPEIRKKKKLTHAKYIGLRASLPSGLKNTNCERNTTKNKLKQLNYQSLIPYYDIWPGNGAGLFLKKDKGEERKQ